METISHSNKIYNPSILKKTCTSDTDINVKNVEKEKVTVIYIHPCYLHAKTRASSPNGTLIIVANTAKIK